MYIIDEIKQLQAEVLSRRRTDPLSALPICDRILAVSEEAGYEYGIAFAKFYSCELRQETTDIDGLITGLAEMLSYFRENGFYEFELKSLCLMGVFFDNKGDTFAAVDSYMKAASAAGSYGFPMFKSVCSCNIGCIFLRLNDIDEALKRFENALEILNTLERSPEVIHGYHIIVSNLAMCSMIKGRLENALRFVELLEKDGGLSDRIMSNCNIVRAWALLSSGDTESARSLARQVAGYLINEHSLYDTMDTFRSFYKLLFELKEYDILEKYIASCLEHTRRRRLHSLEREMTEAYIAYLQERNDTERIAAACEDYYDLTNRLNVNDNQTLSRGLNLRISLMEADRRRRDAVEQNKILKKFSQTDALTYLPNRYKYDTTVPYYFSRAQKEHKNFCYMLLDVDSFKQYNDTYGHLMGDSCLWHIASVFRTEMANDVMFFRYGGDEYAGIYFDKPDCFIENSLRRINEGIDLLNLEHRTSMRCNHVTVTSGYINKCPQASDRLLDFVNEADMRLYKNKAAWKKPFSRLR